jgi:hypothetical protein
MATGPATLLVKVYMPVSSALPSARPKLFELVAGTHAVDAKALVAIPTSPKTKSKLTNNTFLFVMFFPSPFFVG